MEGGRRSTWRSRERDETDQDRNRLRFLDPTGDDTDVVGVGGGSGIPDLAHAWKRRQVSC
jgi:hypothetical protein